MVLLIVKSIKEKPHNCVAFLLYTGEYEIEKSLIKYQ
jgi:hypothetical protein